MINAVILPFSTRAFDHNSTLNRDADDAHPTSAISGLDAALADRYTKGESDSLLADKQKKLTEGANIHIKEDGTIYASGVYATEWGLLAGDIEDQTDLMNRFETVNGMLSVETDNRQSGDEALSEMITTETIERQSGDEAVRNMIPKRNLLVNPWFQIAQRGFVEQSGFANEYIADMWKANGSSLTTYWISNYHTLKIDSRGGSGTLTQNVERMPKGVLTLSANVSNYSDTASCEGGIAFFNADGDVLALERFSSPGVRSVTYDNSSASAAYVGFLLDDYDNFKVDKVKLESGSVSTLPYDEEPDYATETLMCMRYFYRLERKQGLPGLLLYTTIPLSDGRVVIPIRFAVPMAKTPTITVSSQDAISLAYVNSQGSSVEVHSSAIAGYSSDSNSLLRFASVSAESSLNLERTYRVLLRQNSYIDFSAEP